VSIQTNPTHEKAVSWRCEDSERIVQHLPAGVFTVDTAGIITSWNDKAFQITGYSEEEVIGRKSDVFYLLKNNTEPVLPVNSDYILNPTELFVRKKDGEVRTVSRKADVLLNNQGQIIGGVELIEDITDQRQAQLELMKIHAALNDATDAIVITDLSGTVTYVNMAFGMMFKYTLESINGIGINSIFVDQDVAREVLDQILQEESWSGEVKMVSSKNRIFPVYLRATPIWNEEMTKGPIGVLLIINDITDRKGLESQLLQAQKLKAIGQLAAGIAHEINTPMQYVGDNTRFLKDSFDDLIKLLAIFSDLLAAAKTGNIGPELIAEAQTAVETCDMEYLAKEIPTAIQQTLDGIRRVSEIVRAMKEFSHPNDQDRSEININDAILNTITVARNEWKYVAEMETNLDPDLPVVPCFRGEFNQVILNILVNAAQAIEDVVGNGVTQKGKITVRTRREGNWVEIRITDTGRGIPKEVQPRIFDPFFTTKEIGKGTGQGLTISHAVIVEKHKGTITFETEEGKGTTFIIRLPLKG